MKQFIRQYTGISSAVLLALFVCIGIGGAGARVAAQANEGNWTAPVNLSHSGAASSPTLAAGADGVFHVFWQDQFEGFVYTSGDGEVWSQPVALRAPFSEPPFSLPTDVDDRSTINVDESFQTLYAPLVVVGADDTLHVFWQDGQKDLLTSRVATSSVTSPDAWTPPDLIASEVVASTAVAGRDGRLHLAYITAMSSENAPAGIYYRESDDGGTNWTEPVLLYASNYLRSLPADQANLQIEADSAGTVHLVWDEPLLDIVYYTRTLGNGLAWVTPAAIDRRQAEDAPGAAGPARIDIIAGDERVHLTWQAQHQDGNCVRYHQASENGGQSWGARQAVFEDARGCPTASRMLESADELLLLLTRVGSEVFMQASDGELWSKPLIQRPVSRYTHPETYRAVDLACLQFGTTNDGHLLVVGCGTGSGTDVWALRRTLHEVEALILPSEEPVWSAPATIVNATSPLSNPAVVSGTDGRFHVLWIGDTESTGVVAETAIHYSRWRGTQIARPAPIFTGEYDQLSATMDAAGRRLFLVWRDVADGTLLFSRVDVEEAIFPMRWTLPIAITPPDSAIGHPELHVDETGKLHVAYAMTVNEGRGIYLVQSEDQGNGWTKPIRVFDGAAAGWEAVGKPHLAPAIDNALHLLWVHNPLSPDSGSLGLFYARSEDGGRLWSSPEMVVENPGDHYHVAALGDRTIVRVWQVLDQDSADLWFQQSLDTGRTWGPAAPVPGFGDLFGASALVADSADRWHLLQLMNDSAGGLLLREWSWQGEAWSSRGEQTWNSTVDISPSTLATTIDASGQLAVVYAGMIPGTDEQEPQHRLHFVTRAVDSLPAQPLVSPTIAPTAEPLPPVAPAVEATPVPAASFSLTPDASHGLQLGPIDAGTTTGGLIVGVVPAGLAVLIAVGLGLYLTRGRR